MHYKKTETGIKHDISSLNSEQQQQTTKTTAFINEIYPAFRIDVFTDKPLIRTSKFHQRTEHLPQLVYTGSINPIRIVFSSRSCANERHSQHAEITPHNRLKTERKKEKETGSGSKQRKRMSVIKNSDGSKYIASSYVVTPLLLGGYMPCFRCFK